MRSSRIATVAVAAGAALLGWSTVSVAAIGSRLPAPVQEQQHQLHHGDHGHDHRPGV